MLGTTFGRGAAGGGGGTPEPILGGSDSEWNTEGIGRPLVGGVEAPPALFRAPYIKTSLFSLGG